MYKNTLQHFHFLLPMPAGAY